MRAHRAIEVRAKGLAQHMKVTLPLAMLSVFAGPGGCVSFQHEQELVLLVGGYCGVGWVCSLPDLA